MDWIWVREIADHISYVNAADIFRYAIEVFFPPFLTLKSVDACSLPKRVSISFSHRTLSVSNINNRLHSALYFLMNIM